MLQHIQKGSDSIVRSAHFLYNLNSFLFSWSSCLYDEEIDTDDDNRESRRWCQIQTQRERRKNQIWTHDIQRVDVIGSLIIHHRCWPADRSLCPHCWLVSAVSVLLLYIGDSSVTLSSHPSRVIADASVNIVAIFAARIIGVGTGSSCNSMPFSLFHRHCICWRRLVIHCTVQERWQRHNPESPSLSRSNHAGIGVTTAPADPAHSMLWAATFSFVFDTCCIDYCYCLFASAPKVWTDMIHVLIKMKILDSEVAYTAICIGWLFRIGQSSNCASQYSVLAVNSLPNGQNFQLMSRVPSHMPDRLYGILFLTILTLWTSNYFLSNSCRRQINF